MPYRHINFFDKNGYNVTPDITGDGIFEFSMPLDRVSTGLFSVQHLFMLEKVLIEVEGEFQQKEKHTFVPILIQILRYLRDFGDPVPKANLRQFFNFNANNDEYYVTNFLNNNAKYIHRIYFEDVDYYTLTPEGRVYLTNYDESEILLQASNYRLEPGFTRPRAEYSPEFNQFVYLTFNWTSTDNDENIFMFFIDNNDTTVYKGESAFTKDKKFPSIIPAYQFDLVPSAENVYWKIWSEPYRFDYVKLSNKGLESADKFFNNDKKSFRILNSENPPNPNPFQINIALTSNTEGFYERTLEINITHEFLYSDGSIGFRVATLARVNFFGEVVGEDERFTSLLENFGREVRESDCFVFRDSDIYEALPNYIELNTKRKELLLAGEEIYPYIGSYKAFINALKFFGYYDLRLKEYFLNVQMTRNPAKDKIYYSAVEIPFDLELPEYSGMDWNDTVFGDTHNSLFLKKTSRFGLYYDLNTWTGSYDDFGFPIMTDSFQFTNEEILIKLYGLKKILEERFLPHNVRIIDITGEGLYFAKFKINTWQDLNKVISTKLNNPPDFEAIPRSGYIKSLQNLLNIFKTNLDSALTTNTLTKDTVLSNIVDKTLREFLSSDSKEFSFDEGLSLTDIQRFYPDYFALKTAIYNHLRNSPCLDYIDTKVNAINTTTEQRAFIKKELVKSLSYSIQLYGLPVILKLKPYNITWDDLTIPWDALEVNPDIVDKTFQDQDVDYIFTWDDIGYFDNQEVNWFITHENNEYCFQDKGTVKNKKEIMVFLPKIGKYDVSCTVQDLTNFPNMTGKKKYLEVKYPDPDFIAIGRFINQGENWDDFKEVTWNELSGTWDFPLYCPANTTWDDCKLSWDDLYYENYADQTLVKDVNYAEILDYDESKFKIIVKGKDLYLNNIDYANQKWNNTIAVERKSELVPTKYHIQVDAFSKNTITLFGKWQIPYGEKLNCYVYLKTKNFLLNGTKLKVTTDFISFFEAGKYITVIDQIKYEKHTFKILNSYADIVNGFVEVELEDDGSLNEIMFQEIEFRGNNFTFKVLNCSYNQETNQTIVTVDDRFGFIKIMKKIYNNQFSKTGFSKDICYSIINNATRLSVKHSNWEYIDFKAEWGIHSGYFIFNINNVKLDANDNSIVEVDPNPDFCQITTQFNVQWTDYDIDYARTYSNVKNYEWDKINLSWDNLSHMSWDMLEYHGGSITGFKIYNASPYGWIMLDNEKLDWDFRYNDIDGKVIIPSKDEILYNLLKILKSTSQDLFINFDYHLINNDYIQATIKNESIDKLFQVKTNFLTSASTDTYPRNNYLKWEKENYHGINNPAIWDLIKREWVNSGEKFENPDHNTDLIAPFDNVLEGAFNWADVFIQYKNMVIPIGTPLFIIYDNSNPLNSINNKELEWELFEETRKKLLIKTRNRYLIWNFVDSGIYSVTLKIIDKQSITKIIKKQSWITVK